MPDDHQQSIAAAPTFAAGRRAWLELLRLPNLPTVPGDPLAGAALAAATGAVFSPARVGLAVAVSLLLYICGLLLNDWADVAQDARERPSRPVPSRRVSRAAVLAGGLLAGLAGVLVAIPLGRAAVFTASALLLLVLLYDLLTHRFAFPGFINMGLCRAVSLLLGAIAVGWRPTGVDSVRVAGVLLLLYICAVTAVAHRETEKRRLGLLRFSPLLAFLVASVWLALLAPTPSPLFLVGAAAIVGVLARRGFLLGGQPEPSVVQQSIGKLIRALPLIQAVLCTLWMPHGALLALVPLALFALSVAAAKVFYAS